jgi:exodeoxyribonuclease VII large subunit
VIRDILEILERRCPGRHIRLYPAQVQGEGAGEQIAAGVDYFSRSGWAEVVIVARGGGSLEDLWAFNEERVARAIVNCSVPVISAVGHETDFTIADFVADLRAPTPSAAAELVIATRASLVQRLDAGEAKLRQTARLALALLGRRLAKQLMEPARLHRAMGRRLQRADEMDYRLKDAGRSVLGRRKRALDNLVSRLARMDVRLRLAEARRRLEGSESRLRQRMRSELAEARATLAPLEAHLAQLSPLKILDRGYAIVTREKAAPEGEPQHQLVKTPEDAPAGSDVRIRLAKGELRGRVLPEFLGRR